MEGKQETFEALEARHRREQRELVVQLTALKKAAPKGDKKQKREVQVEMARREAELDTRHAQEKEDWQQGEATIEQEETEEKKEAAEVEAAVASNQPKKSKQQRRKEKKEAELKRMEEEAEAEASQQVDMQKVEMTAITELLGAMKLSLTEINVNDNDNSLYNALADQLKVQHSIKVDYRTLRQEAAQFMRGHQDEFIPFLTNAQGNMLDQSEFDHYCNQLANTAEWGGHTEILALSRVYQLPVHIVQMGAPVMKISEEYSTDRPLRISYHRHAYGLGEHYNSLHSAHK
ncbi:hypothetical protein BDF19DRAFT_448103 [Syncephalis fuscata]|nr:hypothetical protein BDF19DRAFT_448103 [Syncephalis fuscata]